MATDLGGAMFAALAAMPKTEPKPWRDANGVRLRAQDGTPCVAVPDADVQGAPAMTRKRAMAYAERIARRLRDPRVVDALELYLDEHTPADVYAAVCPSQARAEEDDKERDIYMTVFLGLLGDHDLDAVAERVKRENEELDALEKLC